MICIYIAAPYAKGPAARAVVPTLWERRFDVCSTWHYVAYGPESLDAAVAASAIEQNDRDLEEADAVLSLAYRGEGGEMFCELTRALIAGKPVYWVSMDGRDVLSAWRPGVVRCATVEEAIERMVAELGGREG